MVWQEGSGIDGVMLYTVDIFRSAGSGMNENLSTIIIGVVQVVSLTSDSLSPPIYFLGSRLPELSLL